MHRDNETLSMPTVKIARVDEGMLLEQNILTLPNTNPTYKGDEENVALSVLMSIGEPIPEERSNTIPQNPQNSKSNLITERNNNGTFEPFDNTFHKCKNDFCKNTCPKGSAYCRMHSGSRKCEVNGCVRCAQG